MREYTGRRHRAYQAMHTVAKTSGDSAGKVGQSMTGNIVLTRLIRLFREERGSELVEFALTIPILLALFFGIMDFSRVMYCYHYVTYAAQEGARFAIVRGADWPNSCSTSAPPKFTETYACEAASSDVQNYVSSRMPPLIDPKAVTVTTTWPGTTPNCTSKCTACSPANSQGCIVHVQVNYAFRFLLPFLPRSTVLGFSGTSEKVIQQ